MDPLERRLKQIPLAAPSPTLKYRIFAARATRTGWVSWIQQPVRLGWALVFALIMAGAGYSLAWMQVQWQRASIPSTVLEFKLIKQTTTHKQFDLTKSDTLFLSGPVQTSVEIHEEIGF